MPAPLGRRGIGLVDWIGQVIEFRRTRAASGPQPVELGLAQCTLHGTTGLGEIAQPDWPAAVLAHAAMDCTVFQELIGPTADRVAPALALARQHLAASQGAAWRAGLAPHAPYSVHPDLLGDVVALAAAAQVPVAFHLAESREEIESFANGRRPFACIAGGPGGLAARRRFAPARGRWTSSACFPRRPGAGDPRQLSGRRGDWHFWRNVPRGWRSSIARGRTPGSTIPASRWRRCLSLGIAVALGTDSRASSPDLSLLAEMRTVRGPAPCRGAAR